MRRPLTLVALVAALPAVHALAGSTFPNDQVVVRRDCYASPVDEERSMMPPPAAPTGRATRPKPSPGRGGAAAGKAGTVGQGAGVSMSAPVMDMAEEAGASMPYPEPEAEPMAPPPEPAKNGPKDLDDAFGRQLDGDRKSGEVAQREDRGPTLDWGASIFLSNDDSMSLASAQRVIYALQHGMSLPMQHIRPHELLNYFSFDAPTPTPEQLFDVQASAMQDGDTLAVALAVQGAVPERQPLDLTMVIDRSCSMEDEGRMAYTQRGLRQMTEQLQRGDRVDLVLFDDEICTPIENWVAGRDDPGLLQWAIDQMAPRGATDLDLGLREGYRISRGHVDTHGRNRRVMVLTDAELNTGDVNPNTVSEIGKAFEADQIRITGVGVGTTFRDDVLDMLTEKGKGAYVFLGSEAVVDRVFGVGFDSLTRTIAHDVQFELDLPESLAMERFYGEEASTNAADIQPINYYAGTSQVFLQDLKIRDRKVKPNDPVKLTVRYRDALTGEPETRAFQTTIGKMIAADRHNVDKARALMAWTDLLQERAMGGEACGAALDTYAGRAATLSDDAEIGFVNGLVRGICGEFDLPVAVAAAPLKVRIDADQPIRSVGLACAGHRDDETLSGSDTVARFDAIPGTCTLTLGGVVDMAVEVEVPATGRDLRCTIRGGRVHCG